MSDGTRTRDVLDHNQVLYQLSYTHHRPIAGAPPKSTGSTTRAGRGHREPVATSLPGISRARQPSREWLSGRATRRYVRTGQRCRVIIGTSTRIAPMERLM